MRVEDYTPMNGYALCTPIENPATSAAGIVLPQSESSKSTGLYKVLKVASGYVNEKENFVDTPFGANSVVAVEKFHALHLADGNEPLYAVPVAKVIAHKKGGL